MAVGTPSRALSTLSPVPANLRTPDTMATPAQKLRTSENRLAAKKDLKAKVAHLLNKDRNAIRDARNKAEDLWYRADLEPDVLEEKLVTAAMDKLAERRAAGIDVSAVYAAFKNYVPPIVYGKDARGDQERRELIELQLQMSCGGRDRMQRNEESDDEELNPYLKKQEGEEDSQQQLQQISAYVPRQKAAAVNGKTGSERDSSSQGRRGTAKATVPESPTTGNNDKNDGYKSLSEDEYESDSTSDTSDTSESSSSDGESEDDSHTPFVAVTRGQPLPTGPPPPTPSRANLSRLKHIRFARRNPNNPFQAVIRGEVVVMEKHDADVDEKKAAVSRKRGRGETEGLDSEERRLEPKGKKSKRA